MNGSVKLGHWVALGCMVTLLASCGSTRTGSWESGENVSLDEAQKAEEDKLMAAAAQAWANRGEESQALAAVEAYKAAVAINPNNAEAWAELSHALYFYADCYLRFDESREEEYISTLDEGTKAGERSLVAQSPGFAAQMQRGALIEDAISELDASAVPALYWRSANLGRWASLDSFATLLSYKDEIRAVMEFCLNNDPTYFYQAPDRYFGVFYARSPGFAGGDMNKSKAHFDRSIEAQPNYLGTRVLLAEEWAVKEVNRGVFEEQLGYVLTTDPNSLPAVAPENACEQKKAKNLMAEADDLF